MNMTAVDAGLANERTTLAWQRTALAIAAGGAILGRLTFGRLGFLAFAILALAITLSLCAFCESQGRSRRPRRGRATLALSSATALLAAVEALALAAH
ncbi:DUF202 domain-containing protein [Rhodococcus sp. NPDC057014]|uniref:DUF202 domain-containing protein n=1 Tax=Rhodococcus sp. NPDC057014 TaxID=3346000 RepID=UPI0036441B5C